MAQMIKAIDTWASINTPEVAKKGWPEEIEHVEWAKYGIRVNAIAPGPVPTEGASKALWASPEAAERVRRSVPLQRFGTPEEIAKAAAYLVSDYAGFITGEVLTMDGGQWLNVRRYRSAD